MKTNKSGIELLSSSAALSSRDSSATQDHSFHDENSASRKLRGASLHKLLASSALGVIKGVLATTLSFCLAQHAGAVGVAPYFQSWSNPGSTLLDAQQNKGLKNATLAFAITNGTCPALSGGLIPPASVSDARAYVNAGGQLQISFGGAGGTYAEVVCSDDELFDRIDTLMSEAGTRRLDWDIEGDQLNNLAATDRRNRVLQRLQAKYPDLYTSFTLGAWLDGFQSGQKTLLQSTKAAGVRIDMINVMTMTFGASGLRDRGITSEAQAVIGAFQGADNYVKSLYPSLTDAQRHAMMGVTPMIGNNNFLVWNLNNCQCWSAPASEDEVFTLADAQAVADFARNNGLGLIGYWSFQRDHSQSATVPTSQTSDPNAINNDSGVAQADHQFYDIFQSAVVICSPTTCPPPPCANYPAWDSSIRYMPGDIVNRNGTLYQATPASADPTWNVNSPPEWTPNLWATYSCGGTATNGATSAYVEAESQENASYTGSDMTVMTDIPGYSGTGAVGWFTTDGDQLTFSLDILAAGTYTMTIRYQAWTDQQNTVVINGTATSQYFPATGNAWGQKAISGVTASGSARTMVQIVKDWGYIEVDWVKIAP